eukprot:1146287-Pelagomonas_calceolata.AAC.4
MSELIVLIATSWVSRSGHQSCVFHIILNAHRLQAGCLLCTVSLFVIGFIMSTATSWAGRSGKQLHVFYTISMSHRPLAGAMGQLRQKNHCKSQAAAASASTQKNYSCRCSQLRADHKVTGAQVEEGSLSAHGTMNNSNHNNKNNHDNDTSNMHTRTDNNTGNVIRAHAGGGGPAERVACPPAAACPHPQLQQHGGHMCGPGTAQQQQRRLATSPCVRRPCARHRVSSCCSGVVRLDCKSFTASLATMGCVASGRLF